MRVRIRQKGAGYVRKELAALAGESAFYLEKKTTNDPVNDIGSFSEAMAGVEHTQAEWVPRGQSTRGYTETLDNYCKQLFSVYQKYDLVEKPDRIFIVDETVVSCEDVTHKAGQQRGSWHQRL